MSTRDLQHFFNNIKVRLGYYDWKLRIVSNSSEGYCWHHNKTIDVGENARDTKQLTLHEFAHVSTNRFCNDKHSPAFWKEYEDLLRRFLPGSKLGKSELHLKQLSMTSRRYYGLCYVDKRK
jgi:hypothetical protein